MLQGLKNAFLTLGKIRITVELPKKKGTFDAQKTCESLRSRSQPYIESLKNRDLFRSVRHWLIQRGLEWSSKAHTYFLKASGELSPSPASGKEPVQRILLKRSQAFLGELSRERRLHQTADHLKRAGEHLGVKSRRAFAYGKEEMARFLGKANGSAG